MNLYEIKENYLEFLNKIENGEIEEDFINDTLEAITDEFNSKVDNIACFIKNLEYESTAIKEEAKKLTERAKQKQNKADKLTEYLESMMIQSGIKKVETARSVSTLKVSKSVKVEEAFELWAEIHNEQAYVRSKTTYEPDKKMIKALIEQGEEIPYCTIQESEKINIK